MHFCTASIDKNLIQLAKSLYCLFKIILSRLRRFYLIIYLYIYEFCDRKRKKLNLALTKLKNLNLKNPEIKKDIEDLSVQKNQLEIEKQDLEVKYKLLSRIITFK